MKWEIEEVRKDTFDVTKNRRAWRYGFDSVDDAVSAIKASRFFSTLDTLTVVDLDGYRHPVR